MENLFNSVSAGDRHVPDSLLMPERLSPGQRRSSSVCGLRLTYHPRGIELSFRHLVRGRRNKAPTVIRSREIELYEEKDCYLPFASKKGGDEKRVDGVLTATDDQDEDRGIVG